VLATAGPQALMFGGAGNDTLLGGGGADTLDGGAGITAFEGGLGNDILVVRDAGDMTGGAAGDGIDTVRTLVDHTLGDFVDVLALFGTATRGTGNAGDNVVSGNALGNTLSGLAGADTIDGRAGDDVLAGGLGADLLTGGTGLDVLRYMSAAEGGDTVVRYARSQDQFEVSAAGFGGGLVAGGRVLFVANEAGAATARAGLGQFVCETDTQTLWWDVDGKGTAAPVALATFIGAPGLNASEFTVIA
jgi:Ca2+-binding RTX toxin-like protein